MKKGVIVWFFILFTITFFMFVFVGGCIAIINGQGGSQFSPSDIEELKTYLPGIIAVAVMPAIPTVILFIVWMKRIRSTNAHRTNQYSMRRILIVFAVSFTVIGTLVGYYLTLLLVAHSGVVAKLDEEHLKIVESQIVPTLIAFIVLAVLAVLFFIFVGRTKQQVLEDNMIRRISYYAKKKKLYIGLGIAGIIISLNIGLLTTPALFALPFSLPSVIKGERSFTSTEIASMILGAICIGAFITFLTLFIKGIQIKAAKQQEIEYNYKTKEFSVNYLDKNGHVNGPRFCQIFNDTHNLGFTKFIFMGHQKLFFKTDLTLKELNEQNDRVDKYKNGDTSVLKDMPRFFMKDGRIYHKLEKEMTGSETVDEPVYEDVPDYDEVTYEDGIEVKRETFYKSVFTGEYTSVTYIHYHFTLRFFDNLTNKPLVDAAGIPIIIEWDETH